MKENISPRHLHTGDMTFYQFDAEFGFWGVPNLVHNICFPTNPDMPILVLHNSDGNRDAEPAINSDQKSIVCLGGSHTWGGGVEQELRFSDRLAHLTDRRVVNLGHCSMGLDQWCIAILEKCAKYRPEIIIIEQYPGAVHRILNNYINGYVRPHFYFDSQGELRLRRVPYLAKFRPIRRIIGAYYAFRKEFLEYRGGIVLKDGYDSSIDPMFLLWKTRHYDSMYRMIAKILIIIRDHCVRNGIKLLIGIGATQQKLSFTSKSSLINYDLPRNRLIGLLEEIEISYVDMTDAMLGEHLEHDPVIFRDGHINVKGHEVFARVLFSTMRSLGWLK